MPSGTPAPAGSAAAYRRAVRPGAAAGAGRARLHLAWDGARLWAWAEAAGGGTRVHPRTVPPAVLRALLPRSPGTTAGTVRVLVAAHQGGEPGPAGEDPEPERRRASAHGPEALAPLPVPALLLGQAAALDVLLPPDLPAGQPAAGAAVPAEDAAFWRAVARIGLDVLADGRFCPGTAPVPIGAGGFRRSAVWLPVADAALTERLGALVGRMPAEGRCADVAAEPLAAARSFLDFVVDALAREALVPLRGRWTRRLHAERPEARFLLWLLHPVPLPLAERSPFVRAVDAWTARLRADVPGVRLVLRLDEPPEAPSPGAGDAAGGAERVLPGLRWPLTVLVQVLSPEDGAPRETVAAAELRQGERVPAWRTAALAALEEAARRFPPAARALEAPVVWLETAEAEELAACSDRLADLGAEVVVPRWWRDRPEPARARLVVEEVPARPTDGARPVEAWASFRWEVALGGVRLSAEEFEELVRQRQPLVRLRTGWTRVDPDQLQGVAAAWDETGAQGRLPFLGALRLVLESGGASGGRPGADAAEAAPTRDGEAPPAEVRVASHSLQALLEALGEERRARPCPEPPGFRGRLRPYQRAGLGWLRFLASAGLGGCLADDMGLGKTVQVLALLQDRRAAGEANGPVLLVAPTSVLANWRSEAQRFTPELALHVHHGTARPRGAELRRAALRADVVLTTYPLLARDREDLEAVDWDGVVLDEAQNIKNPLARQAQAARALRARYRFALTGTPVENGIGDLWSIFAFALPGYLGTGRGFARAYGTPGSLALARLRRAVAPFVLRRTKRDPGVAAELPPKIETRHDCALTPEQASLYEAVTRESLRRIEAAEGMARRAAVLTTLLRLKQVCNHPCLFTGDGGHLEGRSGKLRRLEELLADVVAEGLRSLVFTQFATWARMLAPHLERRAGCPVYCLHGGVPVAQREAMVRAFQEGEGPAVLVLSLRTGGAGLNLTAAQHVFHYDRWWNPAVEAQATDRAHRIGQARVVQVHRLVVPGTLEERIERMLQDKALLAREVVGGPSEAWVTELDTATLRDLFALRPVLLEGEGA